MSRTIAVRFKPGQTKEELEAFFKDVLTVSVHENGQDVSINGRNHLAWAMKNYLEGFEDIEHIEDLS